MADRVTSEDGALANPDDFEGQTSLAPVSFSTDNDDDDYEMDFPVMKILQQTSDEVKSKEGDAGQMYVDSIGVVEHPLIFVPLARGQLRIRKEDAKNIDSEIVCRSNDGYHGVGDPGGDCRTCPFARWIDDSPPDCSHIIVFLGYLPEEDQIVRWSLQRTGLPVARRINTMLKNRKMGTVALKIGIRETGSNRQRYFAPTVKRGDVEEHWEIPEYQG